MNPYKTLSAWHKHNVEVMRANAHGENVIECAGMGNCLDFTETSKEIESGGKVKIRGKVRSLPEKKIEPDGSVKIPLTRGLFALIDESDFDDIARFNWHAIKDKGKFYAVRCEVLNNKKTTEKMHRRILGLSRDECKTKLVDHANHNTLDNRRSNIRVCNTRQNSCNNKKYDPEKSTSYFKGVSFCKRKNAWYAQSSIFGKSTHIGIFDSEIEAAISYDAFVLKTQGEFAHLNFPILKKFLDYAVKEETEVEEKVGDENVDIFKNP